MWTQSGNTWDQYWWHWWEKVKRQRILWRSPPALLQLLLLLLLLLSLSLSLLQCLLCLLLRCIQLSIIWLTVSR